MKNFTLAMALAIGGLTMNGQVMSPASIAKDLSGAMMRQVESMNREKGESKRPSRVANHRAAMPMRAVAGPTADDRVIDETPEGEMKIFQKTGYYYSNSWYTGFTSGKMSSPISRVVTSPDGKKMYVQNPIIRFYDSEENWIVGDIDGDEVTFTFPQLISHTLYEYDDYDPEEYYDYALKLEFVEIDDEGGWYYPAENQTLTFKILPDGSLESTEPSMMIGQCVWFEDDTDEGGYWSWQATGDIITSMKEVTEEPLEVPADVELETWCLMSDISTRNVEIGIKDNLLYFVGSYTGLPNAAVVGTIEGDKVIFKGPQYMGISWSSSTLVYFLTGHREEAEDEDGVYDYFVIEDQMIFDYYADKKVLSCPDGCYLISSVPDRVVYYSYLNAPYICALNPDAEVRALLNPVITNFWDYEDYEGYIYYPEIEFDFPTIDADKQPIDTSKLYYQVILDGEVYEFYSDEYELPDDLDMMTDVPFGYDADGFYASGIIHDVIIYSLDFDSLGIRTLYKNGDNVIYSDIVEVEDYTGVDKLINGKDRVAVNYYDLTGKKVVRPEAGIVIRQTVFSDGSKKVEKVVVK